MRFRTLPPHVPFPNVPDTLLSYPVNPADGPVCQGTIRHLMNRPFECSPDSRVRSPRFLTCGGKTRTSGDNPESQTRSLAAVSNPEKGSKASPFLLCHNCCPDF